MNMTGFRGRLVGSALLMTTAAMPASADFGDALVGGLIGSTIGTVIGNEISRPPARTVIVREPTVVRERVYLRERPRPVYVDPVAVQRNREVQSALNYFGYPVGAADGVIGPRSRNAIAAFQATLGFPATGYLDEFQTNFLLGSYNRALAGGYATQTQMAQAGGPQPLLMAWFREQVAPYPPAAPLAATGIATDTGPGVAPGVAPGVVAQPVPSTTVVVNTGPAPEAPAASSETAVVEPPKPGLPVFTTAPVQASMSAFCAKTNVTTTANGGLQNVAALAESTLPVAEQFCVMRAAAMEYTETALAQNPGMSRDKVREECQAFVTELAPLKAELLTKPAEEVMPSLQAWAAGTGQDLQVLAVSAQICLGSAYASDQSDVALASALTLVGVGGDAYAETLAHHLALGFAAPENRARAAGWYDAAAVALEGGVTPVVDAAPGFDRASFLRAAALRMRGQPIAASTSTLPVFTAPITSPATTPAADAPGTPVKRKINN